MSDAIVFTLLGAGVAAELLCVVGVVVMRNAYDRLHYSAAAATVGPLLILAAVLIREGMTSQSLETIAAVALLFVATPMLVHATARAARRSDFGRPGPRPEEKPE
jgi:monovalent cation/proton antiporter MnhG/PhaG subunit